jgi:hypothetical protein
MVCATVRRRRRPSLPGRRGSAQLAALDQVADAPDGVDVGASVGLFAEAPGQAVELSVGRSFVGL